MLNDDPVKTADYLKEVMPYEIIFVLVPGQHLDLMGTRHGRGFGWYDRFLSSIPSAWIRVGVTAEKNVPREALNRNPWDEPVDIIAVFNPSTTDWRINETRARLSWS